MSVLDVMNAIWQVIDDNKPDGLKKIFEPGKPAGPFSSSLPAAVILTADPAEKREYIAEDIEVRTYKIEIHLFTRDPFERMEQRVRGSYDQLYPLLTDIADVIASARAINGTDELGDIEISDTGPAHGKVSVSYIVRQSR